MPLMWWLLCRQDALPLKLLHQYNLLEAFNTETNTVHATKLQMAVLNQSLDNK